MHCNAQVYVYFKSDFYISGFGYTVSFGEINLFIFLFLFIYLFFLNPGARFSLRPPTTHQSKNGHVFYLHECLSYDMLIFPGSSSSLLFLLFKYWLFTINFIGMFYFTFPKIYMK